MSPSDGIRTVLVGGARRGNRRRLDGAEPVDRVSGLYVPLAIAALWVALMVYLGVW